MVDKNNDQADKIIEKWDKIFKENPFYSYDFESVNWANLKSDGSMVDFIDTLKLDKLNKKKLVSIAKDVFWKSKDQVLKFFKYCLIPSLVNPISKWYPGLLREILQRIIDESTNKDDKIDFRKLIMKLFEILSTVIVFGSYFSLIYSFETSADVDQKILDGFDFDSLLNDVDKKLVLIYPDFSISRVMSRMMTEILSLFGTEVSNFIKKAYKNDSLCDKIGQEIGSEFDSDYYNETNKQEYPILSFKSEEIEAILSKFEKYELFKFFTDKVFSFSTVKILPDDDRSFDEYPSSPRIESPRLNNANLSPRGRFSP